MSRRLPMRQADFMAEHDAPGAVSHPSSPPRAPLISKGARATRAGRVSGERGGLRGVLELLDRRLGLLFLAPGVLCLLVVIAYPFVYNVAFSFTNKDIVFPDTEFVGLRNYQRALADPVFWSSLGASLIWTMFSVAGQLALGFVGALALQRIRRGQTPLRLALIVPWAFPSIVMAFAWKFMLDSLYGVVNFALFKAHLITQPVAWLGTTRTAMPTIVLMNVWFGFPFMLVAILAGLQTIPRELYESARVDGASYWRELLHITLPSLRGIVGTLIVLRTIWVFNNFDFVYLTTGGGPVNATTTLPVYAYQIGWLNYAVGRMAAVAVIMFVILVAITLVYFRLLRFEESEVSA